MMPPTLRRIRTILFPLIALAIATACGPSRQGRPPTTEQTYVEIQNRGFSDMTVYIVEGSGRIRLGVANGNSTTKLPIPRSIVGGGRELQFLADPIGSNRSSVSDRIYVRPGDTVTLTVMR